MELGESTKIKRLYAREFEKISLKNQIAHHLRLVKDYRKKLKQLESLK